MKTVAFSLMGAGCAVAAVANVIFFMAAAELRKRHVDLRPIENFFGTPEPIPLTRMYRAEFPQGKKMFWFWLSGAIGAMLFLAGAALESTR